MCSCGPPHMANQKPDDQLEHSYSSYVMIRDVTPKTCRRRWMIGKRGEKGSGISVLATRHDDDDVFFKCWSYAGTSSNMIWTAFDNYVFFVLKFSANYVPFWYQIRSFIGFNFILILYFLFIVDDTHALWEWIARKKKKKKKTRSYIRNICQLF